MGYDLTARNGAHFRANVWTWPAIQAVVSSTVAVDRDLEMGEHVSAEEATKIAIELERILPDLEERTDAEVTAFLRERVDSLKAEVGLSVYGMGPPGGAAVDELRLQGKARRVRRLLSKLRRLLHRMKGVELPCDPA